MKIIVSAAVTIDGFLDDIGPRRLRLSGEQDLAEVFRIRAESDAILVGAGTVRADDPSLATRGDAWFALRERLKKPPHPLKVTLTRSGRLDPGGNFFTAGEGRKLVFCPRSSPRDLEQRLTGRAEVIRTDGRDVEASTMIDELARRDVGQLLIEGGTQVLTLFLESGYVDRMRLAIAPLVLGHLGKRHLFERADFTNVGREIRLASVERLDGMAILWFDLAKS